MMWLDAYDGSSQFQLLGGLAAPYHDPSTPECVVVTDLSGLIPPWKHIQQKGATQDGVTQVDALYEPTEIKLDVECIGRDWRHAAQVSRDFLAAIDAIEESRLNMFHPDVGHLWSDIRWFQGAPPNRLNLRQSRQAWSLRLQADHTFWQTYDHTDLFSFAYNSVVDEFDVDHTATEDLGSVPQHYTGAGGGYCTSRDGMMVWVDDPADPTTTQPRQVINGPWPGFNTSTDNQVVTQVHGTYGEWSLPESSRNILGGRMNRDGGGDWLGDGVFIEYGLGGIHLYYTIDFVPTTIRRWSPLAMPLPARPGEKFSLVCGVGNDPRTFRLMRGGREIVTAKEIGTGSPLGATHRGVGNGMYAGGALITQATPAFIRTLSAGDNAVASQVGFLERVNVGDQRLRDDYTLFGPGVFRLYDGPGSDEYVEFGPLQRGQVAFLRTDPRVNTTLVQDITPAGLPPIAEKPYKLLSGRFSDRSAIPQKSPGRPVEPYFVRVEIVGGDADSGVLVAGTPLRRYPL